VARLSEIAMRPACVERESSSKRGVLCVERTKSRLGKQGSPKRDDVLQLLFHTHSGEVG